MFDDFPIVQLVHDVFEALNKTKEKDFGEIVESDFTLSMNDMEESKGANVKAQILLAGPTLKQIKSQGKTLFSKKADDELFSYISFKVKNGSKNFVEEFEPKLESTDKELHSKLSISTEDDLVLIGFKEDSEMQMFSTPVPIESHVFGEDKTDIGIQANLDLKITWDDMLDIIPIYAHFLKGFKLQIKSNLYEKTAENILDTVADMSAKAKEYNESPLPIFMPFLMFKQFNGSLKLKCTDKMK